MVILRRWILCGAFFAVLGVAVAYAKDDDNPWQRFKTAAEGLPRAIGDYSAGCLQGSEALPLDGDGYQVMHPSRLRYFGHPALVDFLKNLGRTVHEKKLGVILLGDMSQPRGGRAPGGHASHQTGLDVDIWSCYPKQAGARQLTANEREQFKARSVLDPKTSSIQHKWRPYVSNVLRLISEDQRVSRVFVNPIIKRDLCQQAGEDRAWLGKIRPWYGHDDHFHVRLLCPQDSPDCTPQQEIPRGDGCAELAWWFSDEANEDRGKGLQRYRTKVVSTPKLPPQCYKMLD
jgi:penicillin-insensitive murein endopeptidase